MSKLGHCRHDFTPTTCPPWPVSRHRVWAAGRCADQALWKYDCEKLQLANCFHTSRTSLTSNCRDGPSAGRPLMLRTSGNIDGTSPGEAADQAADSGAGMSGGADVGVIQHGVTKSAHAAVRRCFRLGENIHQTALRTGIGYLCEAEPHALERLDHRSRINRVTHHAMSDDKGARRNVRIAKDNHHVVHKFDAS